MHPLLRVIGKAITFICLLLAVGLGWLWLLSGGTGLTLGRSQCAAAESDGTRWSRWSVGLSSASDLFVRHESVDIDQGTDVQIEGWTPRRGIVRWSGGHEEWCEPVTLWGNGLSIVSRTSRVGPFTAGVDCLGRPTTGVRARFGRWYTAPAWIPMLGLLAIPVALVSATAIARLRRPSGHCLDCGYDLRATPGQCPECGSVPTAERPI